MSAGTRSTGTQRTGVMSRIAEGEPWTALATIGDLAALGIGELAGSFVCRCAG
jgi:hypothetical protein